MLIEPVFKINKLPWGVYGPFIMQVMGSAEIKGFSYDNVYRSEQKLSLTEVNELKIAMIEQFQNLQDSADGELIDVDSDH